jgi:hypothetical protein
MTPTTPRRRPAGPAVGARRHLCMMRKRMPRAPLRWWRRTPRSCLVMSAGLAGLSLPKRKSHLPKCPSRLPPGGPPGPSAVLRSLFMRRVPLGRGGTKVGASGKAVRRRKLTNEHRRLLPPRSGTWSTSGRSRTNSPSGQPARWERHFPHARILFFRTGDPHTHFPADKLAPSQPGLFHGRGLPARRGVSEGDAPVPHLCRNRRQLRTTRDNRPGRKPNNHKTRLVCTCLVSTPSVELRILARTEWSGGIPPFASLFDLPTPRRSGHDR